MPALRIPLEVSFSRKVVAACAAVALMLALAVDLVWPGWPASVIILIGLGGLCWSFGRDAVWQVREHRQGQLAPSRI